MTTSTGYGPRTSRPFFNGNEERYELWEVKFVGYLRLQKLHDTILQPGEGGLVADKLDAGKNAKAFTELTLSIDDRSLSLVLRDAKDDGRKALKILRTHYLSSSENTCDWTVHRINKPQESRRREFNGLPATW